jgi:hypothetical protein
MIRYALLCEHDHPFEGWFGSSDDYDDQHARGLLDCPACGSKAVRKAVMAPSVVNARPAGPPAEMIEMMMQHALEVRRHVEENFEYVGDAFAREARDMHEGKTEEREIYGEASGADVQSLLEDGVPIAPLPPQRPNKKQIN